MRFLRHYSSNLTTLEGLHGEESWQVSIPRFLSLDVELILKQLRPRKGGSAVCFNAERMGITPAPGEWW